MNWASEVEVEGKEDWAGVAGSVGGREVTGEEVPDECREVLCWMDVAGDDEVAGEAGPDSTVGRTLSAAMAEGKVDRRSLMLFDDGLRDMPPDARSKAAPVLPRPSALRSSASDPSSLDSIASPRRHSALAVLPPVLRLSRARSRELDANGSCDVGVTGESASDARVAICEEDRLCCRESGAKDGRRGASIGGGGGGVMVQKPRRVWRLQPTRAAVQATEKRSCCR
jgi:hypothetical protein